MKSLFGGVAEGIRSLRAAAPVPYVGRSANLGVLGVRDDRESQLRSMASVSTLFAIVSRLADSTAEVEWTLYRRAASGKKEDRRPVTAHAAMDLWAKPNPHYQQRLFVEATQQHLDLTGEAWWVVYTDPRAPTLPLELWPVRPDRMRPIPGTNRFIVGYEYCGPDGEKIPLRTDEVVRIMLPNPLDPYRGLGPVQAMMVDLDSARYGAEWNRNFFLNGAEPGGIIQVDARLSDDDFNQLVSRWREQHQGVANAHRVAVLEEGKWIERKFSMRDIQFVELRNVSRETIREAYGFPKMMLGAADDINRANALAGEAMYARWLVQTRVERIKAVLNNQLLPLYGPDTAKRFEWDYTSPVPQSREDADRERDSKAAAYKTLIDAGVEPDDAADVVGLPRMAHREPAAPPPPAAVDAGPAAVGV